MLGDIIGSPYEFDHRNIKTKDFPLFKENSEFTDDTVMTLAIAEGIMNAGLDAKEVPIRCAIVDAMQSFGKLYPHAGYGIRFHRWLFSKNPEPYYSLGNGSAMRVSSVAWFYDTIQRVREVARITSVVTHDHPEGIKGAEATASAIFLARTGSTKEEIKAYIEEEFGYDLNRTCDEIRPTYHHVETCMETVPEAILAFLESTDFEDAIRNAVSLGGDSDTLTAITGSIAEGYYGLSDEWKQECYDRLDDFLRPIVRRYEQMIKK